MECCFQCGNIFLEGLDILIANLFVNPVVLGVLSLFKIIPNMIGQLVGTTFGSRLTVYLLIITTIGWCKRLIRH